MTLDATETSYMRGKMSSCQITVNFVPWYVVRNMRNHIKSIHIFNRTKKLLPVRFHILMVISLSPARVNDIRVLHLKANNLITNNYRYKKGGKN